MPHSPKRFRQTHDPLHIMMDALRGMWAGHILRIGLLAVVLFALTLFALALSVEGLFRLPPTGRSAIWWVAAAGIAFGVTLTCVTAFLVRNRRLRRSKDYTLARKVGQRFPQIGDRLLNALQLRRLLDGNSEGYSSGLIKESLNQAEELTEGVELERTFPRRRVRLAVRAVAGAGALSLIGVALFPGASREAFDRLSHPKTVYKLPIPFSLSVTPGNTEVVSGSDVMLEFRPEGPHPPESLVFSLKQEGERTALRLTPDSAGAFSHALTNLRSSIEYSARAEERKIVRRWSSVGTPVFRIEVIDRPVVQHIRLRLNYPEYSRMSPRIQEGSVGEVAALKGTEVSVEVTASKALRDAALVFDDGRQPMTVKGERGSAAFVLRRDGSYRVSLTDRKGITNSEPVEYRLTALDDAYPHVKIVEPGTDVDLGEDMVVPLRIELEDDFGFERAAIRYRVHLGGEMQNEGVSSEHVLPLAAKDRPSITVDALFDVGSLELVPRDLVEYHAVVYDNDSVSGPKAGRSKSYFARFPTIVELFGRIEAEQEDVTTELEEALQEAKGLREALEEFATELKRDPDIDWGERQQLGESMAAQEELRERLEEVSRQLDDIIAQAEKNELFSAETLEKYRELIQLFHEIATPELLDAMRELSEALESVDKKRIQEALRDFRLSQEEFVKSMERTLEIFQRIRIEQRMDEIVKRLEDLVARQEAVVSEAEEASEEDSAALQELANSEDEIAEDANSLEGAIEELAEMTEPFPEMPTEALRETAEQMAADSIVSGLREAAGDFSEGRLERGRQQARRSSQQLGALLEQMQRMRQEMMEEQLEAMLTEFNNIARKTLSISHKQEELKAQGKELPSNSPQFTRIAEEQLELQKSLSQVVSELIALSKKTFAITPSMGRAIGKTSAAMQEAIRAIEARNGRAATRQQGQALAGLNETVMALQHSMSRMMASGSGMGFEQYMEQLQQLAGQQGALNQEMLGLQLGTGRSMSLEEQAALARLAARQAQVQRSLEALMQQMEMEGETLGRLDGVARDIEEVVKEMRRRRVSRRTYERQERILSRLLDAQRSIRQRQYSKKRQSRVGEDIARSGPSGLPDDMGEREDRLNEELQQALREGYARDYEEAIRSYFDALRTVMVEREDLE